MAIVKTVLTAGRSYPVDDGGLNGLKETYKVVLDAPMARGAEPQSFTGVPAIGSAHPKYTGLVVDSYDVTEGSDGDKIVLTVAVEYKRITSETVAIEGEEEEAAEQTAQVTAWGWDAGTAERELINTVSGQKVLNSADDPFDSVPRYSVPEPTFTKAMKFKQRVAGALAYNCTINKTAVTIGGVTYAAKTLLATISEQREFGDPTWNYTYTVTLKHRSRLVELTSDTASGGNGTEIGWDEAILDAGMREIDQTTFEKKLIRVPDAETGQMCAVTSPALLDGNGRAAEKDDSGGYRPVYLRFAAYEPVEFPDWFYSEPPITNIEEEE